MSQTEHEIDASNTVQVASLDEILLAADQALKDRLLRYRQLLPASLITIGKMALSAPGKVLAWSAARAAGIDAPTPIWPLAVVLSYQAALPPQERSAWRTALPTAAAVEVAMAAADLLDEIADSDPSPVVRRYGPGQALNTANLMVGMAQQILTWEAIEQPGRGNPLTVLGTLQDMLVEAAVGQHLDIAYEREDPRAVTVEMSADMTEKKAGALLAGACRAGGAAAGAPAEIVELLDRYGRALGSISQLGNDIQDVTPGVAGDSAANGAGVRAPKTDIRLRKRTIPVVFALQDDLLEPNPLQEAYSRDGQAGEMDEEALRQAVVAAGGIHFARLLVDVHRANATQALEELEALRPGAKALLQQITI